jgi:hypothetical protein
MSSAILAFQDDRTFQLDTFEIELASFDLERAVGKVQAQLVYKAQSKDGDQSYQGDCTLDFTHDSDHWCISEFKIPGFGG